MIHIQIQGKLKSSLLDKVEAIRLLYDVNKGFKQWYDNKFLKWDGLADYEDERVLNDSMTKAYNELYNLGF